MIRIRQLRDRVLCCGTHSVDIANISCILGVVTLKYQVKAFTNLFNVQKQLFEGAER